MGIHRRSPGPRPLFGAYPPSISRSSPAARQRIPPTSRHGGNLLLDAARFRRAVVFDRRGVCRLPRYGPVWACYRGVGPELFWKYAEWNDMIRSGVGGKSCLYGARGVRRGRCGEN
ncbi:hypothetical protein F5Y11DRAFT_339291 [Daldinia sp. FL1419]|nr:hypothetical protein F5Y11DRAFT_339291 [Daldinia sp. FL1419]